MSETTKTNTEWSARLALRCWKAGDLSWTQLSEVLAELGVSEERATELAEAL
jgi:hypothetical protein